jgi:hypothetical protein
MPGAQQGLWPWSAGAHAASHHPPAAQVRPCCRRCCRLLRLQLLYPLHCCLQLLLVLLPLLCGLAGQYVQLALLGL